MSDEKNPPSTAKKKVAAKKAAAKNSPTKKAARPNASSTAVVKKTAGKGSRAGEGGAKAKRTFPVAGLEDCVRLVTAIKDFNAGNPWSPKEIASAL